VSLRIPDLPPDVRFEPLLGGDKDAFQFSFEVKQAALGPYIVQRWGWDDELQRDVHKSRVTEKPFFKIVHNGRSVGTLSLLRAEDHIRFGEFYLFPDRQGQGLGSRILRHCLSLADRRALPVRLEYLKWNPVGSLYRRHGFVPIGETEIHWLMERPPGAAPGQP
jgi:GNAT superfamily N-acetyltransferase